MNVVTRVPRINICTLCGQHAELVLAGGRARGMFATKIAGLRTIEHLLDTGEIDFLEAMALKEMVKNTQFPTECSLVEDIFDFVSLAHGEREENPFEEEMRSSLLN